MFMKHPKTAKRSSVQHSTPTRCAELQHKSLLLAYIEQKQSIRLGKREEYKIRPVLVKLKDEEAAKEVLMRAKRLRFSEQYAGVFISKDLSRAKRI